MNSFYVDIKKCRPAEGDLAACQNDLNSASRHLNEAGDGLKAMGGALASVGASAEHLAARASAEAKEVAQLSQGLHNILNHYYAQEAGLIGQNALAGAYVGAVYGALANAAGQASSPFGDMVKDYIDNLGDAAKTYISNLIGDFIDKYTNDDGTINFNNVLVYSYTNALNLVSDFFDTKLMTMLTAGDGNFVDLIVDICKLDDIGDLNLADYEFLKKFAKWDLTIPDVKIDSIEFNKLRKLSNLGEFCKVLGPVGEGLNYASIVVSDFVEIFYNDETGKLEGLLSVNNWGYFATDVVIDVGVTVASDLIGNVFGDISGKAVTVIGSAIFGTAGTVGGGAAGATGGSVAGPIGTGAGAVGVGAAGGTVGVTGSMIAGQVTDWAVSGLVSMAVEEYVFNGEYFADIDGDGQKDSAVDYMKDYAHNRVDDIVEMAPSIMEATGGYVDNVVSEVKGAVGEIYDSASEFKENVYDTVSDTVNDVWTNTVDYAENLLELTWF